MADLTCRRPWTTAGRGKVHTTAVRSPLRRGASSAARLARVYHTHSRVNHSGYRPAVPLVVPWRGATTWRAAALPACARRRWTCTGGFQRCDECRAVSSARLLRFEVVLRTLPATQQLAASSAWPVVLSAVTRRRRAPPSRAGRACAQDLTESSPLGAVLSVIAISVISLLFVLQLRAAFAGARRVAQGAAAARLRAQYAALNIAMRARAPKPAVAAVPCATAAAMRLRGRRAPSIAVHLDTRIVVDHSEDGMFQVNFKLTFPDLSCEVR